VVLSEFGIGAAARMRFVPWLMHSLQLHQPVHKPSKTHHHH